METWKALDYAARGNKSLKVRADGNEDIVGLKQLDDHFGFSDNKLGIAANSITTDTAREFARKRLKEEVSTATINDSLRCLRRMLNLAREDGKLQNVPRIHLLKEPPARSWVHNTTEIRRASRRVACNLATSNHVPILVRRASGRSSADRLETS